MNTALKTMILTFTFYQKIEKESDFEKNYLQAFLIEHPLWRDLDFWKASIYNSIINETNSQKKYHIEDKESISEKTLREKNIVFGQLAAFAQNMMMFGIEKKNMMHIMTKYFDFFELDESQIDNLKVFY